MIIDYSVQKTFNQSIDIVDPGNTAIKCSNEKGEEYYMIIKTIMGQTSVLSIGPVVADIPLLVPGFGVFYNKFEYKEKTIASTLNKFINDGRKEISDVQEVLETEV